jgi:hypothetical protein
VFHDLLLGLRSYIEGCRGIRWQTAVKQRQLANLPRVTTVADALLEFAAARKGETLSDEEFAALETLDRDFGALCAAANLRLPDFPPRGVGAGGHVFFHSKLPYGRTVLPVTSDPSAAQPGTGQTGWHLEPDAAWGQAMLALRQQAASGSTTVDNAPAAVASPAPPGLGSESVMPRGAPVARSNADPNASSPKAGHAPGEARRRKRERRHEHIAMAIREGKKSPEEIQEFVRAIDPRLVLNGGKLIDAKRMMTNFSRDTKYASMANQLQSI